MYLKSICLYENAAYMRIQPIQENSLYKDKGVIMFYKILVNIRTHNPFGQQSICKKKQQQKNIQYSMKAREAEQ